MDLSVDPSSPDAGVEDSFFKRGADEERHKADLAAREEGSVLTVVSPIRRRRAHARRKALTIAMTSAGVAAAIAAAWGSRDVFRAAPLAAATVAFAPPTPIVAAPIPPRAPPPAPAPTSPAAVAPPLAIEAAANPETLADDCRHSFTQRRFKDALALCSRAYEARPLGSLAVMIAEIEIERGRAARALTWAKRAVAADPGTADAYVFIGNVEQDAGRTEAAKSAYLKYLQLAPKGRFAADLRTIVGSL